MTVIENQFPFKVYEVRNLATTEAYVYLGKSAIAGLNGAEENYFAHQAGESCFSTFLFASLIGGRNIRIDAATEEDPFIYIDSRWYDFRPCGNESNDPTTWPANNILSTVQYKDTGDVIVYFKGITSDGSIVIKGGNSSFVWSDEGPQGDQLNSGDSKDCNLTLSAHKYAMANVCESNGLVASTQGVPGASDVVFYLKSIIGGNCINVTDSGSVLSIAFNTACNCDTPVAAGDPIPECEQWIPPSVGTILTP